MIIIYFSIIEPPTDESKKLAADMNADGEINVSDAVKLQRFLLGMDIG